MESCYTANNHEVYHHAEYELLVHTLKLIWHNYTQEAITGTVDVKTHWLQLFLYNFQFVPKQLMENDDFKSFFSPIPEELCSFLLEQVFEIISKSSLYVPALVEKKPHSDDEDFFVDRPHQTPDKSKQTFQDIRKNRNFAQLILKHPSECSKIIALRHFLTHQLGHRLLEFLLNINAKYIVSQTSLCNLCINLFPNCPWDETYSKQLKEGTNIFDFVGQLQIYQKSKSKSLNIHEKWYAIPSNLKDDSSCFSICYPEFLAQVKSSDEIALLLTQLLSKVIENESQSQHPDNSIFILTLNFSLDCLRVQNNSFSSTHNAGVIKCHLLKLNEQCLNNIFGMPTEHALNDIQIQCIFAKLIAALESNAKTPKLLYALIYLILAVLHNVVFIYSQKSIRISKKHTNTLKFIDETVIDSCLNTLDDLLRNHAPREEDVIQLFHLIFRSLLKIVENLKKYDQLMATNSHSSHSYQNHNSGKNISTIGRCRKAKPTQTHCLSSLPRLSCYFQNILITLLPSLPNDLLEQSMLYISRSGLCCCHYTLDLINKILQNIRHLSTYHQKCAYKFLYYKLITTIFIRCASTEAAGHDSSKSKSHIASICSKCDRKLRSTEFHDGLLKIYKSFYTNFSQADNIGLTNLLFFLKHLKHLSQLITNDIATGILAEIVLPIFRNYKYKLFSKKQESSLTSPSSPQHTLKFWQKTPLSPKQKHSPNLHLSINSNEQLKEQYNKLVNECLNVFAMYLRDIRLIKAFYNEENITHLEELLEEPFLIRGVCDLIKIGIDNISFLGDTNHEQSILSRRLITLQFNSSERAQYLFNNLLYRVQKQNSATAATTPEFWVDSGNITEQQQADDGQMELKTVDILHIVALQWTLNYELLKTSQYFYNEFAKIYSIAHEEEEKEDHENDDINGDEQQQQQQHNSDEDIREMHSNITLKPGDKTIIDILQLNYNALTAFLMLPPKAHVNSLENQQNTNHVINKDFDSSWELIENFINSMPATTSSASSSSSSYKATATTSVRQPINISTTSTPATCYDEALTLSLITEADTFASSQYDDSIKELSYKPVSLLSQFRNLDFENCAENSLNESIVLFDIRNQRELKNCSPSSATPKPQPAFVNFQYSTASNDPETLTTTATAIANEGIINKVLHLFGSIFSAGSSRSSTLFDLHHGGQSEQTAIDIDVTLLPLYDTRGDCKKLLLKLFEATMAICIKGYQNEEVEKMQKHLRKLKAVILANASSNWEQHAEEHTRENVVIQTLQCLLKIAELSNTVNEPAAVVSTSIVTSSVDDQAAQLLDVRSRRKSFNSTRQGAGIYNYPQLSTALPSKNALMTPTTPTPHTRPISGESCDVDYFSTRASIICPDSELELSENEHDEFFLTADEGYEADAEIQDLSESEAISDAVEMWHSFQPSSRYRTHILHEGICRLVIDILIDLSEKCCEKPSGWCDSLAQLVNRLFVIRDSLGGPLFLLKGFSPILKCNEPRLRELQQCILELIVDLNTPEVLSTFFGILASKNPPIDIIVKYMHYICSNTLRKCQASVELEFPINIDEMCISTADTDVTEYIERKRDYHIYRKASTPFTRAACILPVTHAKLWTPEGFTVSLWLQAKSSHNNKSTSQIVDDDTRSSGDIYTKTHIMSIGSNQAMLSIYLNSNHHLVFETFKPNAEVPRHVNQLDETYETKQTTQELNSNPTQSPELKRNRRNNHQNNSSFYAETSTTTTTINIEMNVLSSPRNASTSSSPFSKALKQTKNVILNSFSNMHLFNGHSDSTEYIECSRIDLKQYRMSRNKWTHLALAVEMLNDSIEICLHIDGLEQHRLSLPFPKIHLLVRTQAFQAITLGDAIVPRSTNNTSCTESHSTLDGSPMRISLTNLIVFNRSITLRDVILNLTAMGPDFTELTQCQVANWKPNYGFLNFNKLHSVYKCNFADAMKLLRETRVLCYSAAQPDYFMGYDTSAEMDNISFGCPYGLIRYGELLKNELQSLQTSTILCGGLSNLLYLFARVVEISSNSLTQALALDVLLTTAFSESQLFTEFQRNDYISLVGYVIKTERCTKDCQLLRSIVNNSCSQLLIQKKGDSLHVNEATIATVVYPKLFISILHRYSDWHRSGAKHSDVLDMLFLCILSLTREKHPQRDFNIEQFNREGLMKELLNLFKVYVIESPNPVFISKKAAEYFVSIISVFAGSPPKPYLLDEIMKLLLLLHKPSECYITHDRSKFYFLLTPQVPVKEKSYLATSTHFGRVTAPFKRGLSMRENDNSNSNSSNSDVDAARQARINRLRKLHRTTSATAYKKPLHEFEENLENVADCAKLNKNALRLVSPTEVSKWRLKYKRQNSNSAFTSSPQKQRSKLCSGALKRQNSPRQKIQRRRINCNSARSLSSLETERRPRLSNTSECRKSLKSLFKTDSYSSEGISALQSGLLLLLKDFLCLLPDNNIDEVLRHYIKVEFLLVLANHQCPCVRTAVIKLTSALTQRLFPQDIQACIKAYYPHHLANQLAIGACDVKMFETCMEWVCGTKECLNNIVKNEHSRLCIQQCFGLNSLLAIASKSVATCQNDVSVKAFKVIKKLYMGEPDEQHCMIEAGLLQCCVKALYHLYSKTTPYSVKIEESIADALTTIGQISLQSNGHIQIIWDIINMLCFYQEKQPINVIKGYRSIQAKLQLNWLNSFFVPTNVPWNFKVQQFPNVSTSETRTRLELFLNKCSQFFMVFNAKTTPTSNETELFQMMVSFSIATNQRCNNFIAWGLQPSQPRELRCFIVDALWISCQDDFLPSIIFEGKMIKALLWLSLLEDMDEPIQNLQKLCKRLGINENDSTWNLKNELQRMDAQKTTEAAKHKSLLDKTVYKFESLAVDCIQSSMVTTRRVAELQNSERKLLMNHMKDYDDSYYYTKWLEIVRRMAYEGAPWYSDHNAETSWELDDTEGPSRVHTRLKRCHLDLEKRFFMQSFDEDKKTMSARNVEYTRPLDYLISSYDQQLNISLNSQILYNFPAKYLPVDGEIDGEIIVTDHKLYFLATYRCKYFYVNCDISNITEIWLKRYQHQEKAFEIFLDTNQSLFFSLQNKEDWKIMREVFCDKIVTPPDYGKVLLITQQWREGLLTNWEYLMTLNQIGGRTYNDLMQYPVFPWILSNYTMDVLDLTDSTHYRNLAKPIAVQNEENEQHYIKNYTYLQNTMTNMGSMILKPYHFSSHYSNSGTVLHFLVRVPPFTSYFLRYQDNNFDLPDRTFHALCTTFSLASRDSTTDVKELIPEFFCLPEMFENFERLNFGCRQSGERVEDVELPPWCQKDPRLFILVHRQALESEFARNNLHHWIDLIFGFKQTGEAAVEAINVFHPATYSVFLESEITDPIERNAVETMVKTYGQMPRQLFKAPHPPSKFLSYLSDKQILPNVHGLRWGVYLGSPQMSEPTLGNTHKLPDAEYLLSFNNTNVVYGLPARSCVMQGAETDTYNMISWGYKDRIVRIEPLNKQHAKPKNLLYNTTFDDISACGCDPNSNQLWFGHKSGRISIYKCSSNESNMKTGKSRQSYVKDLRFSYNSAFRKIMSKAMDSESDLSASAAAGGNSLHASETNLNKDGADLTWSGPTVLIRHTDEITCIALSVEFKLAVTAGKDGIAVIWDLNNWSYVRTIERPTEIHHSPITLVTISHTLGDIVTVHSLIQQQQQSTNSDIAASASASLNYAAASPPVADECFEVTEENLDDFVQVSINPNGKSILRLHSVNARYVQHFVHENNITAVCYSYIKEGVGVNVIATAVEGGIVRLWSSWNLSFVAEIVTGMSNIVSLVYSTHQHLVVLTENSHIQVWECKGLSGNSPKFPQIAYK